MSIRIKSYPVKIEAYDVDTNDPIFVVDSFDDSAASVTISTVVNVSMWDVISPEIRKALVSLVLDESQLSGVDGSDNGIESGV
jgi:hypothetical protein